MVHVKNYMPVQCVVDMRSVAIAIRSKVCECKLGTRSLCFRMSFGVCVMCICLHLGVCVRVCVSCYLCIQWNQRASASVYTHIRMCIITIHLLLGSPVKRVAVYTHG